MKCAGTTKKGKPCARAGGPDGRCPAHREDPVPGGRSSKLNEVVTTRIVQAIRAGAWAQTAAEHAGISETTYYRWMQLGEKPDAPPELREFWEAVTRACADAEVHAIGVLRAAMPGDWRAAAFYLERRYPDRWRRREVHEHTGADGGAVRISGELLTDPELRGELRALKRRVAGARAERTVGPGPGGGSAAPQPVDD